MKHRESAYCTSLACRPRVRTATLPGMAEHPTPPSRLLLIRLGAVGDVVRCLPALEALRDTYPTAKIAWLCEPAAASLLDGQPALDQCIVFPRKDARFPWSPAVRSTVTALRAFAPDTTLDFHGILKSGIFSWLSKAPRRIGFKPPLSKEGNRWFATETVSPPDHPWRVGQFLSLITPLLPGEPDLLEVTLPASQEEEARVDAFLASLALEGRKLVVLYPGSSAGAEWKRWPTDRYRVIGQRLAATDQIVPVVAWGPGEENLIQSICTGGLETIFAAPKTNLRELGVLLRRADLFIGPDTGPAHMAAAVQTPVLGIYGPSDPERNRPLGEGNRILTAGPPMRPRPWTTKLMKERTDSITAHQVYDAAAEMLGLF